MIGLLLRNCINIFTSLNNHYIKTGYFNFSFCFFSRLNTFVGNGGVIYCSNSIINMKINDCIFFYCSCTDNGGAICIICSLTGTSSILNKVCANNCFSNVNQFCRIDTKVINSNLNSIINCSNYENGLQSLIFRDGIINLSNLNSTLNSNKGQSGIEIYYSTYFIGNFSNFINNNVFEGESIKLWYCSNCFFSFSNIIKNNSPFKSGVLTFLNGVYNINDFIIKYNENLLFFIELGQLNLYNCKVFHNFLSYSGSIIFNNIENIITNSINIIHYNTFICKINYLTLNLKTKQNYFLNLLIILNNIF